MLSALVHNGVYPDPRVGLDCYRIPDASDEFNRKHGLGRSSATCPGNAPVARSILVPDRVRPAARPSGQHAWLNFNSINYRAEVWLNGSKVAGERMAGMFQRLLPGAT